MTSLMTEYAPATAALEPQLNIRGEVVTPAMPAYEEARLAWNRSVQQMPALIAYPLDADDVAEAVRFASAHDLPLAVQGTGHGILREANGALLINTSRMKGVSIDAQAGTARVEAGAVWGDVLPAAQAFGLAPLLGSSTGVGVMGYTLGGGMGWLARKHGLSADSVIAFEAVTTNGEQVRASATENADLFWALRGGGGTFAILTAMEIKLYPVSTVFAGNLLYPIDMAKDVMARWREWTEDAPAELTSAVVIMNYPPLPALPEFLRGKSFVQVRGCYAGDVAEGERQLKFWLDWQSPIANLWHAMPFSEADTISNDPVDPLPGKSSGAWLSRLSDESIEALAQHAITANGSPLTIAEVRHAGGAIRDAHAKAAAFGHRDAEFVLHVVGITPSPEAMHAVEASIAALLSDLQPDKAGAYMNFLEGEEARARTQEAFSEDTYHWLKHLKRKVDPRNRLNHAYDIEPA
jgi:FAD/FMN-containing dehydrogenase